MSTGGENIFHTDLSPRQRELVAIAEELGRERFAPRAARYDREAVFPFENYDDLRDSGLLGVCIPEPYGGLGADYETYALVSAEIGRHCGATALSFNMHACSCLWIGSLADDLELSVDERATHERRRAAHYARVVEEGAIYAQTFSEGNEAAAGRAPFGTTARRVDGGWVLNGQKIFASLSGAAAYYGILCTEDKEELSRADTLYIAVPTDADGFEVHGDWDPLGMRGTVSRNLKLEEVFVSDELQMMPSGAYHQAARRWPHMFMTLAGTYLGIARGAYEYTVSYLRGEVPGMRATARRDSATKQLAVAQMHMQLEQMSAIFRRAIREARVDPSKAEQLRAYTAQYTVMEGVAEICSLAIRTCGGRSMLRDQPLERMYRDARCGSLMLPWTAEICLERLGREALYEPGER